MNRTTQVVARFAKGTLALIEKTMEKPLTAEQMSAMFQAREGLGAVIRNLESRTTPIEPEHLEECSDQLLRLIEICTVLDEQAITRKETFNA